MHLAVHQLSRRTKWGVWSPPGRRRRSCRHRSVHGEAFWEERADRVAAAPAQPPKSTAKRLTASIFFRKQTAKCDYATACAPEFQRATRTCHQDEHGQMLGAIRERNVELADELAHAHTPQFQQNFINFMRENYTTDGAAQSC